MDLNDLTWRKSSRSGTNGGECVEVAVWRKASHSADHGGACVEVAAWRKASHSGPNGGECVEVTGDYPDVVAVRDSKNPAGPVLAFAPSAWAEFTERIKR